MTTWFHRSDSAAVGLPRAKQNGGGKPVVVNADGGANCGLDRGRTEARPYKTGCAKFCGATKLGGANQAAGTPSAVLTKSFSSLLGLKKGIFLGGTSTLGAGLGIASDAAATLARAEAAETANLDLVAFLESVDDALEQSSRRWFPILRGSSVTLRTSSMRSAFVNVGCFVIFPLPRWDCHLSVARNRCSTVIRNDLRGHALPVALVTITKMTRR